MRTETLEQIVIRSKNPKLRFHGDEGERSNGPNGDETYRMEIYRIEVNGTEKVFECELTDSIATVERNCDVLRQIKKTQKGDKGNE